MRILALVILMATFLTAAEWMPETVTLTETHVANTKMGTVKIPAGTIVKVCGKKGAILTAQFAGSDIVLPMNITDLESQIEARNADEAKKAAASEKARQAKEERRQEDLIAESQQRIVGEVVMTSKTGAIIEVVREHYYVASVPVDKMTSIGAGSQSAYIPSGNQSRYDGDVPPGIYYIRDTGEVTLNQKLKLDVYPAGTAINIPLAGGGTYRERLKAFQIKKPTWDAFSKLNQ